MCRSCRLRLRKAWRFTLPATTSKCCSWFWDWRRSRMCDHCLNLLIDLFVILNTTQCYTMYTTQCYHYESITMNTYWYSKFGAFGNSDPTVWSSWMDDSDRAVIEVEFEMVWLQKWDKLFMNQQDMYWLLIDASAADWVCFISKHHADQDHPISAWNTLNVRHILHIETHIFLAWASTININQSKNTQNRLPL